MWKKICGLLHEDYRRTGHQFFHMSGISYGVCQFCPENLNIYHVVSPMADNEANHPLASNHFPIKFQCFSAHQSTHIYTALLGVLQLSVNKGTILNTITMITVPYLCQRTSSLDNGRLALYDMIMSHVSKFLSQRIRLKCGRNCTNVLCKLVVIL